MSIEREDATDVQGVVERLRHEANLIRIEREGFKEVTPRSKTIDEAATLLSALQQENARLREERDAQRKRFLDQVDYGIDLARIIEALASDRDPPVPNTTARHHYDMAISYRSQLSTLQDEVRVKALEEAAEVAAFHAHHALWAGPIPYGWGEDIGQFGVKLANRIAASIREKAARTALSKGESNG